VFLFVCIVRCCRPGICFQKNTFAEIQELEVMCYIYTETQEFVMPLTKGKASGTP